MVPMAIGNQGKGRKEETEGKETSRVYAQVN